LDERIVSRPFEALPAAVAWYEVLEKKDLEAT